MLLFLAIKGKLLMVNPGLKIIDFTIAFVCETKHLGHKEPKNTNNSVNCVNCRHALLFKQTHSSHSTEQSEHFTAWGSKI